jgi:hypothetical protein
MTAVVVRIALRYLSGVLVARGLFGADDATAFSSDPDMRMMLETILGLAIAGVSEGWYWAARKFGWSK